MKRIQIQRQIASFTGDWKNAERKAEIFDANCLVPLSQVTSITLSYGRFSYGDHAIDKDTLYFHYTTKDGEKLTFSICD